MVTSIYVDCVSSTQKRIGALTAKQFLCETPGFWWWVREGDEIFHLRPASESSFSTHFFLLHLIFSSHPVSTPTLPPPASPNLPNLHTFSSSLLSSLSIRPTFLHLTFLSPFLPPVTLSHPFSTNHSDHTLNFPIFSRHHIFHLNNDLQKDVVRLARTY
jgi:hypothetical protein